MSEIQSRLLDKLRARVAKLERVEPDGPDERDEAIARLEREIEAERDNAAGLRKTIDEQSFRIEVLEQSYSKQLDDARARAEKAEAALAAEKTRASELEIQRDTLTSERDAARKELDQKTQRERRGLSTEAGTARGHGASVPRPCDDGDDRGLSIDDMLADASIVDNRDHAGTRRAFNGPSATDTTPEDEQALEDMLSPDLVFSDNDHRDD
jgi:hypothetical protein